VDEVEIFALTQLRAWAKFGGLRCQ